MSDGMKVYEVVKNSARLFITVGGGRVLATESPTHACFRPDFLGETWTKVRADFEADGFTVHEGT